MASHERLSGFAKGVAFGLLLAATFVAGGALTQDRKPPGVIEGTEFRIVDKNGLARGSWVMAGDAVQLAMTDRKGRTRVAMLVDDAAVIKFWGEQGQNAIILTQEEARGTWLELADQNGKGRIYLSAKKEQALAQLCDPGGGPRIGATCDAAGVAQLRINDEDRKAIWIKESTPAKPTKLDL